MSAEEDIDGLERTVTKEEISNIISLELVRLEELWCRIGISGKALQDRFVQALGHFQNLATQMFEEDQDLYNRVLETVEDSIEVLKVYCDELGIPEPEFETGPPLFMKKELARVLEKVEELRNSRLNKLEELREAEGGLCEILAKEPFEFSEKRNVPTEEDLRELEQHVKMLVDERGLRFRKYSTYCNDIRRLMQILEKEPSSPLEEEVLGESTNTNSIRLSQHKLTSMKALHDELEEEKKKAEITLEDLRHQLYSLWNLLKVDQRQRDSFMSVNGHCGTLALRNIEKEIERCQQLRSANLGRFIHELREELLGWWEKCQASTKQKDNFQVYLKNDNFTDQLLKLHEDEVHYWQDLYQTYKGLFVNAEKLSQLYEKAQDYQLKAADPSRYHNRGGQLLQEEREKKRLMALIPKMEQDLLELSDQYSRTVGNPFKIRGLSLEDFILTKHEMLHQNKENEKIQRKQRKEIATGTPFKQLQKSTLSAVYNTPGANARSGGMRSIAFKSPANLTCTTPRGQVLRRIVETPTPKSAIAKKLVWNTQKTPAKQETTLATAGNISYATFEMSLNSKVRTQENKRSTLNHGAPKVLASKVVPVFKNSGAKRKRYSSGLSSPSHHPNRTKQGTRPRKITPLSSSVLQGRGVKLTTAEIPMLY